MTFALETSDLAAAVEAGILSDDQAKALLAFADKRRAAPEADEETFRLLTSFNDIFVGVAIALVLVSMGWLGARLGPAPGFGAVAAASWVLAEYFTRVRRMALPSVELAIAWMIGVVGCGVASLDFVLNGGSPHWRVLIAPMAVGAAYAHWARFRVPITVAAGLVAGLGIVLAVAAAATADSGPPVSVYALLLGLVCLATALWWDASDRLRQTRRADVAFWLHLAAAPLIVHPLFSMLGLVRGPSLLGLGIPETDAPAVFAPVAATGVYVVLSIFALLVDRRALMVSALAYLVGAMNALYRATGQLSVSFALSALTAGVGLLLVSVYWRSLRRLILRLAPQSVRDRLPPI